MQVDTIKVRLHMAGKKAPPLACNLPQKITPNVLLRIRFAQQQLLHGYADGCPDSVRSENAEPRSSHGVLAQMDFHPGRIFIRKYRFLDKENPVWRRETTAEIISAGLVDESLGAGGTGTQHLRQSQDTGCFVHVPILSFNSGAQAETLRLPPGRARGSIPDSLDTRLLSSEL